MTLLRSQKIGGVRYIRKAVREALEAEGELAIYYQMYNPQNSEGVPRCTHCLNGAYQQSDWGASMICPWCFGTTFEGGIRQAWFTPLLFSKPDVRDDRHPYGDLAEQTSDLYLPDFISAWKGDFAVRINGFNIASQNPFKVTPEAVEVWKIETPQVSVVKDGLSQIGSFQRVGSTAKASLVNLDPPHPIASVAFKSPYLSLFAPTPKQGALLNVAFSSLQAPKDATSEDL